MYFNIFKIYEYLGKISGKKLINVEKAVDI